MNSHSLLFLDMALRFESLMRQGPAYRNWSQKKLFDNLAWYWNRGLVAFFLDSSGVAHGLCLIRLFRRIEQMFDYSVHDPCGEFLFIDLLVADEPNAMADCFEQFFARFGPQKIVIWDRGDRTEEGCPRMYRWDQFLRLAYKLTYGLINEKGDLYGIQWR